MLLTMPLTFSSIIPTARQPKQLGDYDYVDISYDLSANIIYDISSYIVHDISNNMDFYNFSYYTLYFIKCVNYVSITTEKDNYVYLFLLDLTHIGIPICKVGYTSDTSNRSISLKKKTDISMILLAIMPIMPIKGQFQEISMHNYLKIKCPYCIMDYRYPDNSKATELYKIHPNLIKEFYYYVKHLEKNNNQSLLIKQEETKQIEYIETTKQEQEKTKQTEYIEITKQEQEKPNK